ncbi:MAG: hypothetical protein HRT67_05955 [Flavobacteriaceae bacterium]|nr:hypothetical protein [Flavobacteriaceae bacterium]
MALLSDHNQTINSCCRVKGSTLMETLIATLLIVLVFVLASMILNNLFSNTIKNNTQAIDCHLNELRYLQEHEQLLLPYKEVFENWNVSIERFKENKQTLVVFEAIHVKTNKVITIVNIED